MNEYDGLSYFEWLDDQEREEVRQQQQRARVEGLLRVMAFALSLRSAAVPPSPPPSPQCVGRRQQSN